MTWPAWLPRVLVESALIVFSVLVALAVDQWRDERGTRVRAREAIAAITSELQANRAAASRSRSFHQEAHRALKEIASQKRLPSVEEMTRGNVFQPATILQTAWTTARDTGALQPVPFEVLLKLSLVYEAQQSYARLADAIVDDFYTDVRRRGIDAVVREGFAGFTLLTADFSGREQRLVERYDETLAMLAALR